VASAADPDRMLAQNHPNPFGSSTRIRFALPAANEVTLAVYDIAGRLVRTLAQGPMNAGDYALHWDGRDERGDDVTAGIYFYRLEGTGIDETRKMVLLR
jgi:flagellar hook assembly protein FlgD